MSEIKQFYAGKNVLITGATGFIGKVLVEKLVREFDDINCVYLIIRPGKLTFDQRCKDYLNHLIFDNIRKNKPQQLKKIRILNGDLTKVQLGLSNDELQEIYECVHIVLHCGANVRFDLTIRDALSSNTIGAYSILEISRKIKQLQAFVLVSTAYSQPFVNTVEEDHYKSQMNTFMLVKACDRFGEDTMNALQAKILSHFPNTYALSKHLSEDLVYQYRNEIPICVIRPSVVTCAIKDPLPNYCEGLNGFFGFSIGVLRGVIRTYYLEKDGIAFFIPVDVVTNAVITTSWLHGTEKKNQIEFYNVTVSNENSTSFRKYYKIIKSLRNQVALNFAIWTPNGSFTNCIYYHYTRVVAYQIIPAILIDTLLRLFRQRPILMKAQRKIFSISNLLRPYCRSGIKFKTDRFLGIPSQLNTVDREIFNTNIHHMDKASLVVGFGLGVRKFICHEKEEDLPRAIFINEILHWIHIIVQSVILYYLVNFLWKRYFSDLWLQFD